MAAHLHKDADIVPSTQRIELFSDAVFAILITLLILEVKVPFLADESFPTAVGGLLRTLPHLFAFAFSFFAIAVFWVNHHHFFHVLGKADWILLWHNIHLLFWLTLVPFSTAFLGEYPDIPLVVSLYALNMMLAALAFAGMARHSFFHGRYTQKDLPEAERLRFVRRTLSGAGSYALAAVLAFGSVWVTWALLVVIPLCYVVPRLVRGGEDHAS